MVKSKIHVFTSFLFEACVYVNGEDLVFPVETGNGGDWSAADRAVRMFFFFFFRPSSCPGPVSILVVDIVGVTGLTTYERHSM